MSDRLDELRLDEQQLQRVCDDVNGARERWDHGERAVEIPVSVATVVFMARIVDAFVASRRPWFRRFWHHVVEGFKVSRYAFIDTKDRGAQ